MIKKNLQDSIRKNGELKDQLREERRKVEALKAELASKKGLENSSEPMEVEMSPPIGTAESPPPRARVQITQADLEEFPALRPLIKGKVRVIPDTGRELPPPPRIGGGPIPTQGLLQEGEGQKGSGLGEYGGILLRPPAGLFCIFLRYVPDNEVCVIP